jgi:aryl-alcohol dehydrogenase-like predicted oxidoreductase
MSRLGLGTVQFGMPYGISNRLGQPSEAEVAAILSSAVEDGVSYLDTAFAYPNTETLIGRHLPAQNDLRIVTKTPPLDEAVSGERVKQEILDALAGSLDRLRVGHVYGLLVHHANDLRKPNWQAIHEGLLEARQRGWVTHIGVSVYTVEQLELAESLLKPDLVQGPCNALDDRLVSSPCFARLKTSGTEMHARSIFLQGLLLMDPSDVTPYFDPLKPTLKTMHQQWREQGISPLAGCISAVMNHSTIDAIIVGVNSLAEFKEIRAAVASWSADHDMPPAKHVPIEPRFLDPSTWPALSA